MTPILEIQNLSHIYSPDTPFEHPALTNVDLTIGRGEFVGLIGHTGSGKSTLVQHMNGLLKPTSGRVLFDGRDIWEDAKFTRQIRFHVGLVMQYPEYQLFEETVYTDIAFGPKNMGLSKDEIDARVHRAAGFVGISEAELQKSPFDLSGGQKRRAAIAGVIAMEPDVLILDEPTAGLDPAGRESILENIRAYQAAQHAAVVMVSHSMEEIASNVDRLIVMEKGTAVMNGAPGEVFSHAAELVAMGLNVPCMTQVLLQLQQHLRHAGHVQTHGDELRRVREDLAGCAVHHGRPLFHDDQAVDVGGDLLHRVADHDDGRVLRGLIGADILQNALAAGGVKPGGRLVEDEHVRLHGDDARDGCAALLAAGKIERRFLQLRL